MADKVGHFRGGRQESAIRHFQPVMEEVQQSAQSPLDVSGIELPGFGEENGRVQPQARQSRVNPGGDDHFGFRVLADENPRIIQAGLVGRIIVLDIDQVRQVFRLQQKLFAEILPILLEEQGRTDFPVQSLGNLGESGFFRKDEFRRQASDLLAPTNQIEKGAEPVHIGAWGKKFILRIDDIDLFPGPLVTIGSA